MSSKERPMSAIFQGIFFHYEACENPLPVNMKTL